MNPESPEIERLRKQVEMLRRSLTRYTAEYPSFRTKPIGTLGSDERIRQDWRNDIEDEAIDILEATKP